MATNLYQQLFALQQRRPHHFVKTSHVLQHNNGQIQNYANWSQKTYQERKKVRVSELQKQKHNPSLGVGALPENVKKCKRRIGLTIFNTTR